MIKIIAEAGLNWNNFNEAVQYAEKAKEIGADIIKYQWVKEGAFIGKEIINTPEHQENKTYKKFLPQINKGEWKALKNYCDMVDIEFMCTPSSEEILDHLLNIGVKKIKIGSDRIKQKDLIRYDKVSIPSNLKYEYLISDGYYEADYANMYCVSLYPCDPKFIDFNKMKNEKYIGFSDHTLRYDEEWCEEIKACKNIQYVEKHFKLSDDVIDANVSLNYDELKELVKNIRAV